VTELPHGSLFAGHEIIAVAGRGGMGVVYRARQLDLDRIVALKVIAPALAEDQAFRERFIRESRHAASIDHPNVIPVFAAGESDGVLYLTMRFVEGDDLRTLVRREGPLPGERAVGIVRQVGAALDAAHERGVVHRDVKPANVLLDAGDHAYLTDFGLTKRVDSVSGDTRTGGWVGTLGYVAPEQIRGERVDARTDVYALGCVLFHALTGAPPYRRDSDEATMWAHLNDPPPSVAVGAGSELPPAFDAVVARALAKAPADRFPSAGDLGRAALAAAGGRRELAAAPGRVVATGAAAPEGQDDRATAPAATMVAPPDAARTRAGTPVTEYAQTRVARDGPSPSARLPRTVAWVVVLAALGTATALLVSEGEDPTTPGDTAPSRTSTSPARAARAEGAIISAGSRPNDVVAGPGGRVWVVSNPDARMTVIDARTGQRSGRLPRIGPGSQSVAAGFGRIWVAKAGTRSLVQLDERSGRRAGPAPVPLPQGNPVRVRTGEGSVWVGIRSSAPATGSLVETVAKIDPRTGAVRTIPVPGGVQDLDVGDGAVWVVGRGRETVTRIDVASGRRLVFEVGRGPRGVAVGGGSVWIANSAEGSVTRIATGRRRSRSSILVGRGPRGIAYGAGGVWVTNEFDDSVTRIDPRSHRVVGAPITGVGRAPGAISARGDGVWVVSADDGGVARIRVY